MLFQNEDDDFGLSIRGTCFLARYNNRDFAITAKHNVIDFEAWQYLILSDLDTEDSFDYEEPWTANLHKEPIEDFLVIPLCSLSRYCSNVFADVENTSLKCYIGMNVSVYGFASERTEYDLNNQRLVYHSERLLGLIDEVIDDGIYRIQIDSRSHNLESFDGFSGAPVFAGCKLIGFVIQGSHDTRCATNLQFVDARVIPHLISSAANEVP